MRLRDVLATLPQRRSLERNDGEAEEEVLTEAACGDLGFEVLVRRGEQPHVDVDRLLAADRFEALLLDDAQHLGLRHQRHVGDLVEKERAGVGLLEAAATVRRCSGEGAAHVAEELAFDELLGDRRAVHRDEGAVRSAREPMDLTRNELLAGAVLARDEDARVGARGHPQLILELEHALALADEQFVLLEPGRQCVELPDELALLERVLHGEHDARQRQRLLEEVVGAEPDRLDRAVDVGVARDHDDRAVEV